MEKKREGDREAVGEVFLSSDPLYHCFFGIGDGKGELLKLLLQCLRKCKRKKRKNYFGRVLIGALRTICSPLGGLSRGSRQSVLGGQIVHRSFPSSEND
jgi:hypothetical protein